MKSLQPVNQNVLLELPNENENKQTASGIYLPETAVEKVNIATVVGISIIENAEIAIGDQVWFKPFSGTETEFEGKKYLLLPYTDILAKIVESEAI
jgi:chaperonin GroES